MKKLFLSLIFLFLGVLNSNAQLLKFGVKAGLNYATLDGSDAKNLDVKEFTSFHFGAVLEFKLLGNLALQPELLYSSQGAKINNQALNDIKYDYFTVPVLAKIYIISNKLSLDVGPQFSFLINDSVPETFETNSFDFAAVGGLGINISEHFFIQGRYVIGLTNTTKDAEVRNKVIQASLGYRF